VAHTGLRALDAVADLALVAIPGRTSAVVAGALLAYAQDTRRGLVFAALDAPAGLTADEVVAYVAAAGLEGRTEHGALYWPRVRVPNPAIPVFGGAAELVVPVAGHALGVLARTDAAAAGGVYRAPAGVEVGRLVGVLGAEREQVHDEAARDLIYPHRINPVRGRYLDGARTLAGGGNFPTIGERRGASFIERSLLLGLDRLRHRANTPELRAEVYRTVFQFLLAQLNVGAFATRDPRTAFYVDVSEALNPPSVVFANELRLKIGIATAKPAEFIVIEVAQDTRALEAELANAEG
jgi:phage tail sheath protein FI